MSPVDSGSDGLIGQTLDGRYEVEARIGRGGMGEVYLARHLHLGSRVALKVLAGERAGDPNAARRFVREARSAFRVDHPHCVRVIDLGSSGSALYIAMEYLDGRTVGDELRADGPIEPGRAAHIAAQAADAVAHAHGLGLIHRDLKPENLMLVRRGADPDFVKVLDFGLARVFDEQAGLAGSAISLSPLTKDGLVFGTPEYMSPEQSSGDPAGPASDLYALGAVLYHMVTGAPPFGGQTFTEILSRHVCDAPVPPSARRPAAGIAPALERLILDCLEKSPERRPPGAAALAERLAELARSDRPPARVARERSAAETADLATRDVERAETVALPPVAAEVSSPRRRSRWPFVAAAAAALVAALGLAALRGGAPSSPAGTLPPAIGARPAEPSRHAPTSATAAPIDSDPAAPNAEPSPEPPVETPAEPLEDAPGASSPSASDAAGSRTAAALRADKHLRAAEAARRSGNLLRQLAEADQARRLDPQNRRAALLMGEALVKSGDRKSGCPLLRRSPRVFREAGCAD